MKTLIIILISLFMMQSTSYSADPDFTVLAVSGKALFKKKGKSKWLEISTGEKLFPGDDIQLKGDGYLGMVHKSGKTQEITKSGKYNISVLSNNVSKNKDGLTKRFAGYVMNEMGSADDLLKKEDYKLRMQTTGAVERAIGDEVDESEKIAELTEADEEDKRDIKLVLKSFDLSGDPIINVRIPKDSYLIENLTEFSWYPLENISDYEVIIKDTQDKVVFSQKAVGENLKINLNDAKLDYSKNYYWHVKHGDIKSVEYCINRIDPNIDNEFQQLQKSIAVSTGDVISPMDHVIIASFYKEFNVQPLAYRHYSMAVKLAPSVKSFRKMFALYLKQLGLIDEVATVMAD